MSVHQYPFYPGTGAAEEIGVGAGKGATVNCPLPAGQDDADYGAVFHDLFLPVGRAFAPELIIVSAGYDAHVRDPLAEMNVTERGFAAMTSARRRARRGDLRRQAGAAARGGLRPRRAGARRCARRWRCSPAVGKTFPSAPGPTRRWRWRRRATRSGPAVGSFPRRDEDESPSLAAVDLRVGGVGRGARQPAPRAHRPRGLGLARQPGARPPRQPRPPAGRRVHGRRARRRAGRPLRSADAALALSFGRRARRRDGGRRGAGRGGALRVASSALLCAVDRALSFVRHGGARFPVVPVGQPAARVRPASPPSYRRTAPRRSFTSCFVSCCSSSTSSRASPSGSRSSATGRTAAR